MRWRDDSAALAANWRTIVVLDMAMGTAILAGGLVLALMSSGWGWALAAVGFVQLFFAGGRAVKWRRLRREAGV